MTHSCQSCTDPDCDKVGQDMRACEHYTEDIEDEEAGPAADVTGMVVLELSEEVDRRSARVDRLYDVLAASVKAAAGEGL